MALLEVRDLRTSFKTDDGIVQAVDGVSFSLDKGKTLGIVGESGCGKSVTMLTVMGLNPKRTAISSGEAIFKGEDMLRLPAARLREIRGNDMAMIFQDPMTSLNPVYRVGKQLMEAVLLHQDVTKAQARARALELLKEVGIPRADQRIDDYPHQFSGGMRQRVMIAMALINNPDLLIADEPTTALDVTVQAGILRLLDRLRREHELAVVLITHDLGVMSAIADRVSIFYAGRVVESGLREEVLRRPRHPYTRALLDALPHPEGATDRRLVAIGGMPPSPGRIPAGCAFNPRCRHAQDVCLQVVPPLERENGRRLACHVDPYAA